MNQQQNFNRLLQTGTPAAAILASGKSKIMRHQKLGPRAEYRQGEDLRIKESLSLSAKFPKLKSLRVELTFFPPDGVNQSGQIKYIVNLDHAKSVFRFDCLNKECVCGDFDLSEVLAGTIAKHRTTAAGEMRCNGWRNKETIKITPCHNLLRYKLTLAFGPAKKPVKAAKSAEPVLG
jgi:hypothetical protein